LSRSLTSFFLILIITTFCAAFRPAPPCGTPSLVIQEAIEIPNVHIDCFLLGDTLQVVFLASVEPLEPTGKLTLRADWPTDPVSLFVLQDNGAIENEYTISPSTETAIEYHDLQLSFRITYEIDVYRAVSGPPGPWEYARVFALYAPFIGADESIIQTANHRIRLMLPPEFTPASCENNFNKSDMLQDFVIWEYNGPFEEHFCKFRD